MWKDNIRMIGYQISNIFNDAEDLINIINEYKKGIKENPIRTNRWKINHPIKTKIYQKIYNKQYRLKRQLNKGKTIQATT